jgi:hypothetical protein
MYKYHSDKIDMIKTFVKSNAILKQIKESQIREELIKASKDQSIRRNEITKIIQIDVILK